MKILSIETSCDDTGISVLEVNGDKKSPNFKVLANEIASQTKIGKKYGGVFPAMAKREHQKNLMPVLIKALKQSGMCHPRPDRGSRLRAQTLDSRFRPPRLGEAGGNDGEDAFSELKKILEREPELAKKLIPFLKKYAKPDIDLISVTNGPGLEPCLWVGVNFAKALSYFWGIPIVPVNHIEGHILVNFLKNNPTQNNPRHISRDRGYSDDSKNSFPAICLVVSGGHTQIILMKNPPAGGGDYEVLGETRDDAAGECFDKCAKILGLGYPGGPIISKLAEKIDRHPMSIQLPRPMFNTKDYDFSFSGLKTAVLYAWAPYAKASAGQAKNKIAFAKEIQQAIIDVLLKKTLKAVKDFNAKTVILGGGVSANQELRNQFTRIPGIRVIFPDPKLSTDNGLMIAIAGYFNQEKTADWNKIQADGNMRIGE